MRTSAKDQSAVNCTMLGEMGRERDSRAIGVANGANGECVLFCSTAAIMRPLLEGERTWRRRAWADAIVEIIYAENANGYDGRNPAKKAPMPTADKPDF
jgi:hypothetical protein